MGCLGMKVVDPEVEKLLASLDSKVKEYEKTFVTKVQEMKKAQSNQLKLRHDKLSELKQNNQEITEDVIKKLNKEELEVEIGFLSNAVDQMHYIFDLGLDLVEPLKKITIDKLLEQAKSAPAITANKIKNEIEDIKKIPAVDFLKSTHGKVLKNALEKKGMSETLLKSTKKNLMSERSERRKKEREEFGIKVNEFDDENIDKMKLDLYSLVENEYNDINKVFKDYARDKIIEGMYGPSNA